MTTGLGSPFFVIPNQVLKQVQDLRISGSRFLVLKIWVLKPRPVGGVLYYNKQKKKVIIAREFLKEEGTIVNAINKLSFP